MAQLLVLTSAGEHDALPALGLLNHQVRFIPLTTSHLLGAPESDLILVDARRDLAGAKSLCTSLRSAGISTPVIVILSEGGFTAIGAGWGATDVIIATAGPAETEARLRMALEQAAVDPPSMRIHASGVTIDEANYSAKVRGKPLDLTYKEFELLRFFASHPARVFTREQLLSEVWGYDYFGGTRTVDVHVRRLRAKLGDLEQLIGTVRNVGYRFNLAEDENDRTSTRTVLPDSR
ncbi:two-component system response regulator GlnR [Klugiella xanthotipulae]|uniref:DNA-binding response OmpR family regulator n=1 Tax=Klugiella xanthotipulae TaxID=244735 RepID=A0A543HYD8_9MICO|nr:response regulator transcription factor [Klugiella xanthotipulae]TQM63366.1 DNA-binding response OmpR family regulator [Klugiella xanthotipulae]